jgi:hypothetical protein
MESDTNEPIPLLRGGSRPPVPPQADLTAAGPRSPLDPVERQLIAALDTVKRVDYAGLRMGIEDLAGEGDRAEASEQHDSLAAIMADMRALDEALSDHASKAGW